VARAAWHADVVYSTGMIGRSSLGTAIAGKPIVIKLTSDPVFERSLRWGLWGADLGGFQNAHGLRIGLLRKARDLELARATKLIIPSEALRGLAIGWGVPPEKVVVIPNPVSPPPLDEREALRARHGLEGRTLVFAGRLVPQKSIDVALDAVVATPDVSLLLAGEGPYRERLEAYARSLPLDGRARFLGPQPRQTVFELLRAADAALLSSSWENFPHMVVEALAVGTPVISTDAGGVTEILRDDENGLLVPMGDAEALAAAIRRYFDDPELAERLRAAGPASVARFAPDAIYARLESLLEEAASDPAS
jgi:glycosyltransferase involved in cell wall biosynthesis